MNRNNDVVNTDSCPYWIDHMCFKDYLQKLREDVVNECLEVIHKNNSGVYWELRDQFEDIKKVKDYSFTLEGEPDKEETDEYQYGNCNKESAEGETFNNDKYELVYKSEDEDPFFNCIGVLENDTDLEFDPHGYTELESIRSSANCLLQNMEKYFNEPDDAEECENAELEDEPQSVISFQNGLVNELPDENCDTKLGTTLRNLYQNGIIFQRKKISFFYENETNILYLWTRIGFWKVIEKDGLFLLFHKNHFASDAPFDEMCMGRYHRQSDLGETKSLDKIVRYVVDHDHAKEIIMDDYRNLPTTTKRQKRYYKQTKKKIQHKNIKRTEYLLEQIENGNLDQFKMSL